MLVRQGHAPAGHVNDSRLKDLPEATPSPGRALRPDMATRLDLSHGHQYPEALLDFCPEVTTEYLAAAVPLRSGNFDSAFLHADPRHPTSGFRRAVESRAIWDERISRRVEGVRR